MSASCVFRVPLAKHVEEDESPQKQNSLHCLIFFLNPTAVLNRHKVRWLPAHFALGLVKSEEKVLNLGQDDVVFGPIVGCDCCFELECRVILVLAQSYYADVILH